VSREESREAPDPVHAARKARPARKQEAPARRRKSAKPALRHFGVAASTARWRGDEDEHAGAIWRILPDRARTPGFSVVAPMGAIAAIAAFTGGREVGARYVAC
jgi:hypothetical protein